MWKHIDDVQSATVKEHFDDILNDKRIIEPNYKPIKKEDFPGWYEEKLFKQGQDYYRRNSFGIDCAQLCGLIATLANPSVLKVLIYTKQSSAANTALKRYLETYVHMYYILTSNVNDENSKFYKSLNTIRWKHAMVNERCIANKVDLITQKDMVLTQYGFIGYVFCSANYLGLTNDDREAYNHFWRVLGYLLGIPDNINLCRKSETETTELCQLIRDNVFSEYIKADYENFQLLTKALLDGFWYIDMSLNSDAFLTLAHDLAGLKYTKPLSVVSNFIYGYYRTMLRLFYVPVVGSILRTLLNYKTSINIWISLNYPILAKWRFGNDFRPALLYPNKNL